MPPTSPPRPGRRTSGRKRPPSAPPSRPRHGLPPRKPPAVCLRQGPGGQCAEARAALPAADREEARRALAGLENERCALRAGMDAAASALAKARQDCAAAEAAVTALTAQQTEAGEAADPARPRIPAGRSDGPAHRSRGSGKALTARLLAQPEGR